MEEEGMDFLNKKLFALGTFDVTPVTILAAVVLYLLVMHFMKR